MGYPGDRPERSLLPQQAKRKERTLSLGSFYRSSFTDTVHSSDNIESISSFDIVFQESTHIPRFAVYEQQVIVDCTSTSRTG